jgi:hypothetical protein
MKKHCGNPGINPTCHKSSSSTNACLGEIYAAAVDRAGDRRPTAQSENVMTNAAVIHKLRLGALGLAAGLALSAAPIANAHGGGGGGHGASSGGGHGGFRGGRGGFGLRYGSREGFGRFGYDSLGFYDFGFLGYGLFFDALPLYSSMAWWDGVPYYYASDNLYQWNEAAGQYESLRPPLNLMSQVTTTRALGNGTRPIASNVSAGRRAKQAAIPPLRLAPLRSVALARGGRIISGPTRRAWKLAATASNSMVSTKGRPSGNLRLATDASSGKGTWSRAKSSRQARSSAPLARNPISFSTAFRRRSIGAA